MNKRRIRTVDTPLYDGFKRIFESSFPVSERRTYGSLERLIETEERFHCEVVSFDSRTDVPDDRFSCDAIICYWTFEEFLYVEYLAIDDRLRGGGHGTAIMRLLTVHARTVVLEVEPPADSLTRRRVGFYERLGFVLCPDSYVQPSYGVVPGIEMRIMVYGLEAMPGSVQQAITILKRRVYGCDS